MFDIPEWPYFLGEPQASGVIRSCPEDFVVEEITRVHPEGEGSHICHDGVKGNSGIDRCAANCEQE